MLAGTQAVIKAAIRGQRFGPQSKRDLNAQTTVLNQGKLEIQRLQSVQHGNSRVWTYVRIFLLLILGGVGIAQSWDYLIVSFMPSLRGQVGVAGTRITDTPTLSGNSAQPNNAGTPSVTVPSVNTMTAAGSPPSSPSTSDLTPGREEGASVNAIPVAQESKPSVPADGGKSTFEQLGGGAHGENSTVKPETLSNDVKPIIDVKESPVAQVPPVVQVPQKEHIQSIEAIQGQKEQGPSSRSGKNREQQSSRQSSKQDNEVPSAAINDVIYCTAICPPVVAPMIGNSCPLINGVQSVPLLKQNSNGTADKVGCVLR